LPQQNFKIWVEGEYKGLHFRHHVIYNDRSEFTLGDLSYFHIYLNNNHARDARGGQMIRRSLLLLAFVILVTILVPSCNGSDSTVTPGSRAAGTIEGFVINVAISEPVPGATVTIKSEPFVTDNTGTGVITIVTSTDVDGTFFRNDIPNGFVTVSVKKEGFKSPDRQYWALTPGGGSEFRFEVAPGADPIPPFDGDEQEARPPDWTGK